MMNSNSSNNNMNNNTNSSSIPTIIPTTTTTTTSTSNESPFVAFQQQQFLNSLLLHNHNNNNTNNQNNNNHMILTNLNTGNPSSSNSLTSTHTAPHHHPIHNNMNHDNMMMMNLMIHQWNVLSPQQQEQLLMLFHANSQHQQQQQSLPMNVINNHHPLMMLMNNHAMMMPTTTSLSGIDNNNHNNNNSTTNSSTNVLNHLLLASQQPLLMMNPNNTTSTSSTHPFFTTSNPLNCNPQTSNLTSPSITSPQDFNMLQQFLLGMNVIDNTSVHNNHHPLTTTTPITTNSDFTLFNDTVSTSGDGSGSGNNNHNMDENSFLVTDQQIQTNFEELFQQQQQPFHQHTTSPFPTDLSLNLSNIQHHQHEMSSSSSSVTSTLSQPSTPRVEGVLLIDQQFDTNTLTDFGLETFSDMSPFDNVHAIVEQNLKRKLDVFLEPTTATMNSGTSGGLKQSTSPLANGLPNNTPSVPVSSGFSILDKLPPHQQREYFKRVKMMLTEDDDDANAMATGGNSASFIMDQIFNDSTSGGSGGSDERSFHNFLDFEEDPTASIFSKVTLSKQSPLNIDEDDESSETTVLGAEFEINPMIYTSPLEEHKSPTASHDESLNENYYSSQQAKKSRSSSPVDSTSRRVINSQTPTVMGATSTNYIWNNMILPVSSVSAPTSASSTPFIIANSDALPKRKSSGAVKSPNSTLTSSPLMQTSSSSSASSPTTNQSISRTSQPLSTSTSNSTSKSRPSHRKFPTNYFLNMVRAPPNSPMGSKSNSRASSLASSANNSRTNSRTNSRSNSPTTSTPPNFYTCSSNNNMQMTDAVSSDQQQMFANSDFMLKLQKSLSSLSQVSNNPFSMSNNNSVNHASRILVTPTPEHHFVNIPGATTSTGQAIVVPQNHYLTNMKPMTDQQQSISSSSIGGGRGSHNKSSSDEKKDNSLNMMTTHDSSGDFSGDLSKQRKHFLPTDATEVLKDWFLEHIQHPYPSGQEKQALSQQTGLSYVQVSNWFTNTRKRSWQVMKKEYEKRNGTKSAESSATTPPTEGSSEAAIPGILEDANNK
ncbi:hypothetical protein C9374_001630 [Naegleria lovaniensis]|uniref:Homeobox domain-containing protein n=1 Tax=Naegleria lovaniensis TaxID=51637 RepID=A0AA88GX28_NAELO|nr:uncharacterized protein C9374_001630 [Naegleria lovaniensis]KAG2387298.1 hypothetical protein C9374_001630 [Naegleria lovaniensis]